MWDSGFHNVLLESDSSLAIAAIQGDCQLFGDSNVLGIPSEGFTSQRLGGSMLAYAP